MRPHVPCIPVLAIFCAILIGACQDPKGDPTLSTVNEEVTAQGRYLPFLAGQRIGIAQGNNGPAPDDTHKGALAYGVDFNLDGVTDRGLPAVATSDGVVVYAKVGTGDAANGCNCGWGNSVMYCNDWGGAYTTTSTTYCGETMPTGTTGPCERYGHMREVFVRPGERVKRGQVIGLIGASGNTGGPHLHDQVQNGAADGTSIPSTYVYRTSKVITDPDTTGTWTGDYPATCSTNQGPSNQDTPSCVISTNEGMMGVKAAQYGTAALGNPTDPRSASDLGSKEGWLGYGWYSRYAACEDTDTDSETTCSNGSPPSDAVYRKNAYIRRFIGGSYGNSAIVYDPLSGATSAYLIHTRFLKDPTNGWDALTGPKSVLGMPLEDERTTTFGTEQCFQWGKLRWLSSSNTVYVHPYPTIISGQKSVGPGVFAADGVRTVPYWDRQVSYRIADAWLRNGGYPQLGYPVSDNNASVGVHVWSGTRFLVQNFDGGTKGPSIVMYDPENAQYARLSNSVPADGWNRAYAIQMGFWGWYRNNNGINVLKAPIGDEYPYGTGTRQNFLCGVLEWNGTTGIITPYLDASYPLCNLTPAPVHTSDACYKTTGSTTEELLYDTGGGGYPADHVISCTMGPSDMSVQITGPIQSGVFSQMTTSGTRIEYGSDTDGWSPYTSGKPWNSWIGDTYADGASRTYSFILGNTVQNMNFFLYDPLTGAQPAWFDLSKWTVVGDCWKDTGGIRHASPPPASGNIACSLTPSGLEVSVNGQIQSLLVGGAVTNPTKVLYGSDTDGWTVPYASGKPYSSWNGTNSQTLVLPPNTYNFNLYLTDGTGGRWFDLNDADGDGDAWAVGGACRKNNGVITHDPPPNGTINCVKSSTQLTVTINGPVTYGIFGLPPAASPIYLEYGSDTDGWSAYTSGKPKATWTSSTTSYTMILSPNVQDMNFFLYAPSTGSQPNNWFDLNHWTVTGDCWRNGGGLYHN